MIVDILDEMTAEITKLIVQLDHKKLVMPSSRNDGTSSKPIEERGLFVIVENRG